ncbi:DNA-methyltransferase [Rhodococcus ruber]|uniref:Methyltransferase n=1 Tax=Rhodococcus ruber TaxID=1830 RepID=A0A098BL53_9NOCA|nr:site-specific DNA-methyltransferase [Rhodococcus ruber]MCZ4533373.1 site-specific DNA-methyltransferase [Rhodococcus ruber]MCZ4533376.1 site-specific DNA-methyltransferase [Rhodococcus ruber]CDZ88965.1 putative DNA modification methylase [Rhodococcus ruber]
MTPKPYYQDDFVTLYHGDYKEIAESMPDASADCVITDPPYTDRTHTKAKTNKGAGNSQAIEFAPFSDDDLTHALMQCGRISKRWVIASLDYAHAFSLDANPPEGLRSMRVGVWVKTNPMPQITGDRPGQGWEAILFMHRAGVRSTWNGGGRSGVWTFPVVQNAGHPTSKPLGMVSEWVRLFTDPGGTVFDPFAGSGTTLRAAKNTGRRAIGVELEERYCEIIAQRCSQEVLDFGIA